MTEPLAENRPSAETLLQSEQLKLWTQEVNIQ